MIGGLLILLGVSLALLLVIAVMATTFVLTHPPCKSVGTAMARGEPNDPEEMGVGFESHLLRLNDGHTMKLWQIRGQCEDGPVVIVLHGWGDSRIGELRWLNMFLPIASGMILFDLRGHGEHPARVCTWGLKETYDVQEIIEWAIEKCDAPVILFGYSMGAAIALRVTSRMSGQIDALIVDSPLTSMREAVAEGVCKHDLPTWPLVPMTMLFLRLLRRIPSEDDIHKLVAGLNVPLLLLQGEDDIHASTRKWIEVTDGDQNSCIELFPGCGHLGPSCQDPDRYRRVVHEFLEKLDQKKRPGPPSGEAEPFRGHS